MARRQSKYPTELELQILKILWRDGAGTVRHVRQALHAFRHLAHTSVMTVMGIMTEKGYLRRQKQGRRYLYMPAVTEAHTTQRILADLVNRVFDGSAAAAMLHLLETEDLDDKELAELRRIIGQKSREASQ